MGGLTASEPGLDGPGSSTTQWAPRSRDAPEDVVALVAAATEIAATCGLRAVDAIYAAVARQHDAVLVTLDAELRRQGADTVRRLSPEACTRERSN